MMYSILRPWLFALQPETAHAWALKLLSYVPSACFPSVPKHPVQAMGLSFPHRVGLAAGLDKNAAYLPGLSKLGFSFIEVGTVTPQPQEGNPKPRLFRIKEAHALINRMGFNNAGVDQLIKNIQAARYTNILGINIGKNKDTPLDKAADDYMYGLEKVYRWASYITLNISSPNTPDLRRLHEKAYSQHLIEQISRKAEQLTQNYQRATPLVVKISPDENEETLKQLVDVLLNNKISGMIISNTTCDKQRVLHLTHGREAGGLSGQPLFEKSLNCLKKVKSLTGNALTLIAAGGIDSPAAAQAKLQAGADLLQLYTGLIYQGPRLVRDIVVQTIKY